MIVFKWCDGKYVNKDNKMTANKKQNKPLKWLFYIYQ